MQIDTLECYILKNHQIPEDEEEEETVDEEQETVYVVEDDEEMVDESTEVRPAQQVCMVHITYV